MRSLTSLAGRLGHRSLQSAARAALLLSCVVAAAVAGAHGNVTPQAVDTHTLPSLGDGWKEANPFRADPEAIKIGASAFNQNCARCHGLEAISGGIAPDLRRLDNECATQTGDDRKSCWQDNDGYFLMTVRHGRTRNGAVYMPPFEGVLNQEAMWSIKAYLETRRERAQ